MRSRAANFSKREKEGTESPKAIQTGVRRSGSQRFFE
jgi:hypothetical protein